MKIEHEKQMKDLREEMRKELQAAKSMKKCEKHENTVTGQKCTH